MKTAKEVKINNRTHTQLTCTACGATTLVKASVGTKTTRQAMARRCGSCAPRNKLCGTGWWLSFGLPSNPYVYGPMPRYVQACATEWRKLAVEDGWRGLGLMNTQLNVAAYQWVPTKRLRKSGKNLRAGITYRQGQQ